MEPVTLYHGDCLEVMQSLPDNSIDLIATDPPYHRFKPLDWDRQHETKELFLAWMEELCQQWQRLLKPNGSLYVFASHKMARNVGNVIAEYFNILMDIRWRKSLMSTQAKFCRKEDLRNFFPASETIWFAEHFGADNMAKGEAGYRAKCGKLQGLIFDPLRAYLVGERDRAGWTTREVAVEFRNRNGSKRITGMAGHWFDPVQWQLPKEENYLWLRSIFNRNSGDYLKREYDDLKREYDDLKQKYEVLRRPFSVDATVPYTDVWDFRTVNYFPGKHPCEKPVALMEHIIRASSREGAMVLDSFMGRGTTGIAAINLGRRFIGIEKDEKWFNSAHNRINEHLSHQNPDGFSLNSECVNL